MSPENKNDGKLASDTMVSVYLKSKPDPNGQEEGKTKKLSSSPPCAGI
jgi:hypothetical protein